MRSSHSLDTLSVQFDDDNAVADAGLLLPATLAQHLGLRELLYDHVSLGDVPGGANVGDKAMTLIASLISGGECIDDADALRAGETDQVLGHWVAAPSTLGTFLRAFSFGHTRQLDVVSRELLARAWDAGAGGDKGEPVTVDVDSTICETYGLNKLGGSKFTYNHVRGYHPLASVVATTGEVVHTRLRGGPSHAGRGAASFVTETVARLRAAGASGEITIRADSGFYNHKVVAACRTADVRFSITAKMMGKALPQAFRAIPDKDWSPIPYFIDGAAIAEIAYTPFATKKGSEACRLIVRRVPPTPGSQLALFTEFSYHAFITDKDGDMVTLEADHRAHAEVENTIRDLKYGMGLNHMPSGRFGANAAWLCLNAIAHNLVRWVSRIGLCETLVMTKTMRRRYFSMPGRITTSARKDTLHLPTAWPWAARFSAALVALRAISLPLRI
ncbi:MAG: IS1380 family transposase [Tepidisphaeraceae bacterium]